MENYSGIIPYISFELNGKLYAYNVNNVVEVLEMQKITVVPKSAPYIMGVINFRGEILPIIDVRIKCDFVITKEVNIDDCVIIVLEINKEDSDNVITVGAFAEKMREVISVKPVDINPVQDFDSKISSDIADGMFRYNDNLVTILNAEKIFSVNDNNEAK